MREIALTRGFVAIVDDEDFERTSAFKWHANVTPSGRVYAARKVPTGMRGTRTTYGIQYLHHFIVGKPVAAVIDHANRNSLDDRRENLKERTQSQNILNSVVSEAPGTFFCHKTGRYAARASRDKRRVFLGRFDTEAEAIAAVRDFRAGRTKTGT